VRWLISVGFFGGKVCIINQVHDALYLDVHVSVLHDVAVTLKIIMESVPTYFKTLGYDLCVPFPVEVEAGPNMNNKVKVA
jgi:DNA polymerase I-like protein with 3'-5' exonuclease and polymerase domains